MVTVYSLQVLYDKSFNFLFFAVNSFLTCAATHFLPPYLL